MRAKMAPSMLVTVDQTARYIFYHRKRLGCLAASAAGILPYYKENGTWPPEPFIVPVVNLDMAPPSAQDGCAATQRSDETSKGDTAPAAARLVASKVDFWPWALLLALRPDIPASWTEGMPKKGDGQPVRFGVALAVVMCSGVIRCVPAGLDGNSNIPITDYETVDWVRYVEDGTVVRR